MSKQWFDDNVGRQVTADFNGWWSLFYGSHELYEHDEDEYWIRKAFAWHGWKAHAYAAGVKHDSHA